MLAAASTTENASARAEAKPGEAAGASRAGWRPGPPRALARSLVRSFARSLTHRVSSARRRRGACRAAEDAWGAKLASPPRGGSHGAGAAAGPARGLLGVHCVRLRVCPRGAGPGRASAGPGPSRERGALAAGAGLARPALPPRPEAGGARRTRSYLPSTCLRRLSVKSVSAYSKGSTHELHINTHVQATYVQARWRRAPRHEGSIVRMRPSPVGCLAAACGVDPLRTRLGS